MTFSKICAQTRCSDPMENQRRTAFQSPSVRRATRDQLREVLQPRSHDAVIRVYDEAGNVIETHEHAGDFKEL
jgi:hypothetical protein